jgi:hypothetical protein
VGRATPRSLGSGVGEGVKEAPLGVGGQGGAQHPGGERGERLDRLLGVGVADDDEQCRTAGLQGLVQLAEEPLVEPEGGQPRAGGSGGSADGGEQHRLQQQQPNTPPAAAPLAAPTGASRIGWTSSTRPSSRR